MTSGRELSQVVKLYRLLERYDADQAVLKAQYEQVNERLKLLELLQRETKGKVDFPTFDGSEDPIGWLKKCDYFFKCHQTPEVDKVGLASQHLHGDAQFWLLHASKEGSELSWDEFKDLCNARFGPAIGSSMGKLAKLHQNGQLEEYNKKFEQLLSHAGKLSPEQEVEIYISGLQEAIKVEVKRHSPTDLSSAMNIARLFEDGPKARGTTNHYGTC